MEQELQVTVEGAAFPPETRVILARVREAVSSPTSAELSLVCDEEIDEDAALGQPALITIDAGNAGVRRFHLIVTGIELDARTVAERRRYNVELEHELCFLKHRADVRMFQEKSVKDIVTSVLEAAGVEASHFEFRLESDPPKRTYCVQYRETDFAFISRLLEHEGISYFIKDDESKALVTFTDMQSAFSPIEGESAVAVARGHGDGIDELVFESRAYPSTVTLADYNWTMPSVGLTAPAELEGSPTGDLFEFPGGHKTPDEGSKLAQIRSQAQLSAATVGRGSSNVVTLSSGSWFELEGARRPELAAKYLLTRVEHRVDGLQYKNTFECSPHNRRYRPPVVTPKPRVAGLHTAVVTGPSGSEIHTEEMGQMKALFFWDRVGQPDDKSSCWMRLAQLPIDGSMALARTGWEMAVAYHNGDPDRPVGVARLYNAEKTSPYAYPAAKSAMAFQTASSPGGGKINEISMEDSAGKMGFSLTASKDYIEQTSNNKTETISANEVLSVGTDREVQIGASETISIGGNESFTVSAEEELNVKATRTKVVGGSETVTVSGNIQMVVEGADTETTGGSHTTLAALGVEKTSSSSQSLTVGGSMLSVAGLGVTFAVAGAKSETIGGAKIVASGQAVAETVIGALATTVGGVLVQAAPGNRVASTKGSTAVNVGGAALANGAKKVMLKGKKVSINVGGMVNLLGGGGIINMTPGSVAFVGLVTVNASGSVTISGNPNLVG